MTFFASLAVALCAVLLGPWDPQRRIAHRAIIYLWGRPIVRSNPFWKLKIEGTGNIDPKQTYVIVSNHTSMADILCLYCLDVQFKWIAKKSLFRVPFLGWSMSFAKYVPLERGRTGSIRQSYEKTRWWLDKNMSVLIFPEGTRSPDGSLGEFKNGAFKLAIEARRPILPIALRGNEKIIAKGKRTVSAKVEASLTVFPAIATEGLAPGDFQMLKQKVRSLLAQKTDEKEPDLPQR